VARPTGDADRYQLRRVLPRRNSVSRRKPGKRPDEQPVAVNIDLLCIVTSPGVDYSPRRIERYAENVTGELRPRIVVVINKTDLMEDAETFLNRAREDVPMLPVVGVSALNGAGLSGLEEELSMGRVVALVGSSGVGKTSLIRALAEQSGLTREDLRVAQLRRNEKGRHTTSSRRIYPLPSGALLVDLPGMREVQVLGEDGEGAAFADIEALAGECRFRDCRHKSEPGCAVKAAVEAGEISSDRYESYLQLQYEASTNRAERVRQRQKIGMAIAKANRRRKKGQRF
jgi:ribosome biogenesis GTPase